MQGTKKHTPTKQIYTELLYTAWSFKCKNLTVGKLYHLEFPCQTCFYHCCPLAEAEIRLGCQIIWVFLHSLWKTRQLCDVPEHSFTILSLCECLRAVYWYQLCLWGGCFVNLSLSYLIPYNQCIMKLDHAKGLGRLHYQTWLKKKKCPSYVMVELRKLPQIRTDRCMCQRGFKHLIQANAPGHWPLINTIILVCFVWTKQQQHKDSRFLKKKKKR